MELTDLLNSFQEHSAFNMDEKKKTSQIKGDQNLHYEDKIVNNLDSIWQGGGLKVEDL